jgi:hypothetical protein
MYSLRIDFNGTLNMYYQFAFSEHKRAVQAYRLVLESRKDDPVGDVEIIDDFGHIGTFKPNAVIGLLITDAYREQEAGGELEIVKAKATLKIQEKVRKDTELQSGVARQNASKALMTSKALSS